jgi:acetyl-CoA acetyltransferase
VPTTTNEEDPVPDAVICEPLRTPVGGFGGALRDVPVQELASTVIKALMERTGLPPESVDDVLLGHCYPTMDAPALGRVAALDAGLPVTASGSSSTAAAARACRRWPTRRCRCPPAPRTSCWPVGRSR